MPLIKLTPDLIVNSWPDIEQALSDSIPSVTCPPEERNSRVLESLLIGKMECFVWYREDQKIVFFVLTSIVDDPEAQSRSFLLYLLYGFMPPTVQEFNEALEFGKQYAMSKGCSRIIAYSNNESVLSMVERMGADVSVRFIVFPLVKN